MKEWREEERKKERSRREMRAATTFGKELRGRQGAASLGVVLSDMSDGADCEIDECDACDVPDMWEREDECEEVSDWKSERKDWSM